MMDKLRHSAITTQCFGLPWDYLLVIKHVIRQKRRKPDVLAKTVFIFSLALMRKKCVVAGKDFRKMLN